MVSSTFSTCSVEVFPTSATTGSVMATYTVTMKFAVDVAVLSLVLSTRIEETTWR